MSYTIKQQIQRRESLMREVEKSIFALNLQLKIIKAQLVNLYNIKEQN